MYSVKNTAIDIVAYDKNGKVARKTTLKNRLLDNYLDYIIFNMLPSSIGYVLFPKFNPIDSKVFPLSQCYIKYDTAQAISDTSTNMSYDTILKLLLYDSSYSIINSIVEETGINKKSILANYRFSASDFIPENPNAIFKSLGFGRDSDYTQDESYWLLSYVDIGLAGITFNSDFSYKFIRYDEISTNEKSYSGSAMLHLPGGLSTGKLKSISTCCGLNGEDKLKEYDIDLLTFTYVSVGKVAVTGFDNFYIEDNILYPSGNLYPSNNLYPTQNGKIRSVRFKYDTRILYSAPIYDYVAGEEIETYLNIEDLDLSYHDTEISINLTCERGDY